MELLIAFILISLLIGLCILAIKTSNTPEVTNNTSSLNNSLQNINTIKQTCLCGHNKICPSQEGICGNLYIDIDDCGSSQYIAYMKQFTPKQHQAEMDREVEEIWENITWADLND